MNSSVEHVTLQLTYGLDAPNTTQYTLKVWGCNEYLVPTTFLSDYEYVHDCIKLDEDIVLILIPDSKKDKSFARTVCFIKYYVNVCVFNIIFYRFRMIMMMRL